MSEPANDYADLLEGGEHRGRNRLIGLAALALLVAGGAYALWAMVLSGGGQATAAVQTAKVETGTISKTVSTTGTVAAQSTTNLSFDQSGRITAVNVKLGQEVKQGDVLAELDSTSLQRSLSTAEIGLASAQTRLKHLLEGSTASELASADQSLIQAQASYNEAIRALQDLQAGPTASEQLSAQQAVTSAQAQLDQAKLALSDLTAAPTASEELAAEQGVTSAQAQLDQANRALSDLQAGPTESELLSAQQAVTSAQAQLDQAEASRAQLDSTSSDAIAAAQQAVNRAQDALDNAERTAASAADNLTSAGYALIAEEDAYCDVDSTLTPPTSPSFCATRAEPISSADEQMLLNIKATGTPAAIASHAASVLAANSSYKNALATKANADAAVTSAQEDLTAAQNDLATAEAGPSSDDIARADAAVTAAQQALDAANAKLTELNAGPTASELATAQENVTTATGALNTAKAKLTELNAGPTQSDKEKAQENVVIAAAGLSTAQAKLDEVNKGATPSDLAKAQDAVNTAGAALTATQAKVDETYAGSTPEDVALQRDQMQLAQLSVAQAQKSLDGTKLIAPYDGTVAALNIAVGDMAGASSATAPIVLNTPNAVRLNLTITESDLPTVKAGQSGIATFDALSGSVFPIVIDSIGTNPTTTQGVVTYQVRARFVPGATGGTTGATTSGALGGRASRLAGTPVAGATPPAGAVAPGGSTSPVGTPAAAGTPVAGATPPAGVGAPGANASPPAGTPVAGATPAAGGGTPQAAATSEVEPLPGMNATVIITVQQAQNVLVVPDRAIQTQGGNSVVQVQKDDGSTETAVVQTGLSDGTNTEITSGLEEGQTVILPTRTVTTSAQATTTTRTGTQGGGFQFEIGGGPPSGAGGVP
jgi:multidrug resistance efflux pump